MVQLTFMNLSEFSSFPATGRPALPSFPGTASGSVSPSVKNTNSLSRFKSHFCHVLDVWPWTWYFIFLYLSFPAYKMGLTGLHHVGLMAIWNSDSFKRGSENSVWCITNTPRALLDFTTQKMLTIVNASGFHRCSHFLSASELLKYYM